MARHFLRPRAHLRHSVRFDAIGCHGSGGTVRGAAIVQDAGGWTGPEALRTGFGQAALTPPRAAR